MNSPNFRTRTRQPRRSHSAITILRKRFNPVAALIVTAFLLTPQFAIVTFGNGQPQNPKPANKISPSTTSPAGADKAKATPVLGQSFRNGSSSRAFKLARREYEKKIRRIRFKYLAGNKKLHEATRLRGFAELEKITDPTAVQPLIEVLRDEGPVVRNWLLDHLAHRIDAPYGQAAVTWLSIYDKEESMRDAARLLLVDEANPRSQFVIDQALRLKNDRLVDNAALAAGQFKLVQAIPLLIAVQAGSPSSSATSKQGNGALAFIQVQKQRFFVSGLQPVVGINSAGFAPVLSVLQEGTVLTIDDAVVEFVRPRTHTTLLDLVRNSYGESVDFGYNYSQWRQWYQTEYLPSRQTKSETAEPDDG